MISISTTKTLTSSGEILDGQIIESTYDEQSLLILKVTKSLSGEEATRTEYTYEKSLLVKEEVFHEETVIMKRTFEHDKFGDVIVEKLFDDSKKKIYDIVNTGNRIIEKEYDHYSKPTLKLTKHIDELGYVVKEVDEHGETVFVYRSNNLMNCKMYEDGELVMNEDYFYDAHNNEIKSVGVSLDIEEEIVVIKEYNDSNKLIKEEQFLNKVCTFIKTVEYNSENQVTKIISLDKGSGETELTEVVYSE